MNMQLRPTETFIIFDTVLRQWIGNTGGPVLTVDLAKPFETYEQAKAMCIADDKVYRVETTRTVTDAR